MGYVKTTSPVPPDKRQIPAAQRADAFEGNPLAAEHGDPTETTGHQNSNTDKGRNGTDMLYVRSQGISSHDIDLVKPR